MQPLGQVYDYKGVPPQYDRVISVATLAEVEDALRTIAEAEAKLSEDYAPPLNELQYYVKQGLLLRRQQILGIGGSPDPSYELYREKAKAEQPGLAERIIPVGIFAETWLGEGFQDIIGLSENYDATTWLHTVVITKILGGTIGRVVNFGLGGADLNSGGDVLTQEYYDRLRVATITLNLAPTILYPFLFGQVGLGGPVNGGFQPKPSPCHLDTAAQKGG